MRARERGDGKMQPACFVCGAIGHQCGECLLHLNFLKAKGDLIDSSSQRHEVHLRASGD